MKIGILTWHKECNHGAVLQAYASQEMLKKLGANPVMLDYIANDNNMDNAFGKRLKRAIKRLKPDALKVRKMLPEWNDEKVKKIADFRAEMFALGDMYSAEKGLDKVLIGSDMVFDFYEGYNPFMYGKNVNCDYIFAYAACFGYTTDELFETYEHKDEIIAYIKKMKALSYRDDNTGHLLKKYCGANNAVKAIDPVMLYGFKQERKLWAKHSNRMPYMVIYSYTYNMDTPNEIRIIKKFAEDKGLKIVSVGYIHTWCDENVNASPMEFIDLFENADYIVTDTFHGTVFSLTFSKQFAVVVRNNAFKIVDVLDSVGLYNRSKDPLEKQFKESIDYNYVETNIEKLRKRSFDYLKSQVAGDVQ